MARYVIVGVYKGRRKKWTVSAPNAAAARAAVLRKYPPSSTRTLRIQGQREIEE